jgi:hypothetical protein
MSTDPPLSARRHVRFPPGSGFLLLPARPARAGRAGLALYDTVRPRQRAMLAAGSALTRTGLQRLLPTNERADVDWPWWEALVESVASPLIGHVGHLALRVPPEPFSPCALLLSPDGRPLAFAKAGAATPDAGERVALELLDRATPTSFRTPAHLAVGQLAGVDYRVLEPLPEGPHRDPPDNPEQLWSIVDEYRSILRSLPRPDGIDPSHVPCHGDLHVRNLRECSDGQWWLFDWERFRWAPPLADELRYWSSVFGGRLAAGRRDAGGAVLELLRARGSDEEVAAAIEWRDYQPKRAVQRAVYNAVGKALAGERGASRRGPHPWRR